LPSLLIVEIFFSACSSFLYLLSEEKRCQFPMDLFLNQNITEIRNEDTIYISL